MGRKPVGIARATASRKNRGGGSVFCAPDAFFFAVGGFGANPVALRAFVAVVRELVEEG